MLYFLCPSTQILQVILQIYKIIARYAAYMSICAIGADDSVFHRPVRYSAFCPGLTITIEQQNKFSTLVLRSASVAGGDE